MRQRQIPFMKLSGSGNDFILIDHRRPRLAENELARFAAGVCTPHRSLGADGVILITRSRRADFGWRLFNADGSEAEMSGNGGRCAARFAYLKGIAGRKMRFETAAGIVEAEVFPKEPVEVRMLFPEPRDLRLGVSVALPGKTLEGHFIEAGVPHLVYLVPTGRLEEIELEKVGPASRRHPLFQPAGTNVDWLEISDPHTVRLRTYERGVEGETLSCGSGSVAAAVVATALGKTASPVTVMQRSGGRLIVSFDWDGINASRVFLRGDAVVVCEGEIWEEAWR